MPGRSDSWWISPAVPTIANSVLAVLWLFSAVGGWGDAAFCGEDEQRDQRCSAAFDDAVRVSAPLAVLATVLVVTAWSMPGVRRRPDRLDTLLAVAAVTWVLAEGVLFIGGYLAES
ncbi:hypothetical protein BZB76_5757 [Actinomadura pelletieri DSM 43383]|uniref:Uncharacterized protein n=1 Tax=Actinomadura pelletieri DSM 43383 TaxID=1120940 RepID=A0A495QHF3_9ACTN|nr:hypothetical protein BZB76_5757 [Actinomadura pelletieri DSM 43383]